MTLAINSQTVAEVLSTNPSANARASQVVIEVLRPNPGVVGMITQTVLEVLRPNADIIVASTARPQVFVCT